MTSRLRRLATLNLVAGALLLACAPAQTPAAAPVARSEVESAATRVLVGIRGAPASLSVAKTGANVAGLDGLELLARAGLAHFDDREVLRPQLAEAVPSIENGQWRVRRVRPWSTRWLRENPRGALLASLLIACGALAPAKSMERQFAGGSLSSAATRQTDSGAMYVGDPGWSLHNWAMFDSFEKSLGWVDAAVTAGSGGDDGGGDFGGGFD